MCPKKEDTFDSKSLGLSGMENIGRGQGPSPENPSVQAVLARVALPLLGALPHAITSALTSSPGESAGRSCEYLWEILDQCDCELDVGEAEEKLQPRGDPDCSHNHGDEHEEPGEQQEADGWPGHTLVASLGRQE